MRKAPLAALASATMAVVGSVALAQSVPGQPPSKTTRPPTAPPPAAKAPAADTEPRAGGDAQLRQRVEQLEEQLIDLLVVVGTLESLARSGGSPGGPPAPAFRGAVSAGGAGADAARFDGLETQIRALTAQLEQLGDQVRALDGRRAGAGQSPSPSAGSRDAATDGRPSRPEPGVARGPGQPGAEPRPPGGFGQTTVTPGDDAIGRILSDGSQPPVPGRQAALAPPADGGGNAKQLYETAYGYLLQQNYGAAESGFDDFLQRYPGDPLAGNAQYWLGESHFVRGNYKAAASAFLKGYQTYARSTKAPDSLLKLAMSLERLGQKDAACSSYNELNTRFPSAPPHVKSRADSERRRVGC